jgi:hypothetical protein
MIKHTSTIIINVSIVLLAAFRFERQLTITNDAWVDEVVVVDVVSKASLNRLIEGILKKKVENVKADHVNINVNRCDN